MIPMILPFPFGMVFLSKVQVAGWWIQSSFIPHCLLLRCSRRIVLPLPVVLLRLKVAAPPLLGGLLPLLAVPMLLLILAAQPLLAAWLM
jgi:hypothetical protein